MLIVEKNDFASGTTSRATRIIHGGLRYLEHGELGLVRESLRERERLLRERPHLVRPMNFIFALGENSRHSAMQLRAGLWLYRQMAGRNGCREPSDIQTLYKIERQLDAGQRWALFQYDDAQCEYPERLVAEWLGEALSAGAVARNHTEVLEVTTGDGRVRGVRLRDRLTGLEQFVAAEWVVNACGPWVDHVYGTTGLRGSRMIGGIRGSHIVLPKFEGSPSTAIYTEGSDGRPIFVIPWAGQLLVGTTEVPDREAPDYVQPSEQEFSYLLSSLKKLYPRARIASGDISYAFAGVRPLPHSTSRHTASITRRHMIRNHAEDGALGLLSIIGGKLTTAAELARHCAKKIGVRRAVPKSVFAALGSASGIESTFSQWSQMMGLAAGISEASARAIAEWHGARALAIVQMARSEQTLREPICEHSDHIVAEAVEAIQHECAMTLGDILLRRVPVALSPCFSGECAHTAARKIGHCLGWDGAYTRQMLEDFEWERERFLVRPKRFEANLPNGMPAAERAA